MIHKTILPILLLLSGLASISKAAPMPTPKARPDFLPSTPPAEKAIAAYTPGDALVRVVTAQTDPQKRKQAVELAARMFDDLLDPRLLAYRMEGLDDLTTYKVQAFGEGPKTEFETRWDVKRSILNSLITYLQMNIDKTPFKTPEEAANCAALKAWLMANWTAIANKCAEVKVNPGRKRPIVDHQPWDARW